MIYRIEEANIKPYLRRLGLMSGLMAALIVAFVAIVMFYLIDPALLKTAWKVIFVFSLIFFVLVYFLIYSSSGSIRSRRWEVTEEYVRQFVDMSTMNDFMKQNMLMREKRGSLKLSTTIKRKYISKKRKGPFSFLVKGMLGKDKIEFPREMQNYEDIVKMLT